MGHASITITLDRYGHLFPALGRQVAEGLDRVYSGVDSRSPPAVPSCADSQAEQVEPGYRPYDIGGSQWWTVSTTGGTWDSQPASLGR